MARFEDIGHTFGETSSFCTSCHTPQFDHNGKDLPKEPDAATIEEMKHVHAEHHAAHGGKHAEADDPPPVVETAFPAKRGSIIDAEGHMRKTMAEHLQNKELLDALKNPQKGMTRMPAGGKFARKHRSCHEVVRRSALPGT